MYKNKIRTPAERLILSKGGMARLVFSRYCRRSRIKSASVNYINPTKGDLASAGNRPVIIKLSSSAQLPNPNDESLDPKR